MNTQIYFKVIIILSFFTISLSSCKSISKVESEEHPDFFKYAEEYSLSHSFPQILYFDLINTQVREQHFIAKNQQTKERARFEVYYINTTSETEFENYLKNYQEDILVDNVLNSFFNKMDSLSKLEEEDSKVIRGFNKNNYFYQGMTFYSPLNNINYFLLSKVYFYRDRLQIDPPSVIDKSYLFFPLDFWIFEEDKEIGFFSFKSSSVKIDGLNYANETNIFINNKKLNSKFHGLSYKTIVAFDYQDQLVALFELKPPKAVAVNETYKELVGKVLIKGDSSKEFTAEIFTTYIIVDLAYNFLKEDPFRVFDE